MLLEDLPKRIHVSFSITRLTPRTLKNYKGNSIRFIAYLENEFQITELDEVKPMHPYARIPITRITHKCFHFRKFFSGIGSAEPKNESWTCACDKTNSRKL